MPTLLLPSSSFAYHVQSPVAQPLLDNLTILLLAFPQGEAAHASHIDKKIQDMSIGVPLHNLSEGLKGVY